MKEINVRELLRNFKTIFPIPEDGIKVKRRGGDFYMYPSKKRKPFAPVVDTIIPPPIMEAEKPTVPLVKCWWNLVMGSNCDAVADKHVKIASTQDGEPMPSDWKEAYLCSHHLDVIKATNMFSIEE